MPRPITLFTGQWADLPFEEVCRLASEWGYDGLEVACWGDHLDVVRAAEDQSYAQGRLDLLAAIAGGTQPLPSFADGLAVQRVLDAVARSAASGNSWESVH